ncbi:hypothetical protein M2101_000450 [Parabacteroides sp. PM5-20]|uniref:hypothetical protein n=1 Tax=unclassified Parabacteroides TaxID=2649774 RepID=UPI0013CFE251|nr:MULTISPECIES: hypothetical protein [unclassified Parabacteroides]MDH6533809.1 hypothetical protein [Parabacteroides sp. PM5-20]
MKRFTLLSLLILLCSLPGYSQFWVEFGWHEPHCRQCLSMIQSLRLSKKQAAEYQKIVHKYGQRIEKETRRDYKHWDKAARKIYDLRMDRDRKIQRLFSPSQFDKYVYLSQERPQRIHDYRGWYENPAYAGRRHSSAWRRYEDRYWTYHWKKPVKKERYERRPAQKKKAPYQIEKENERKNNNNRHKNNSGQNKRK